MPPCHLRVWSASYLSAATRSNPNLNQFSGPVADLPAATRHSFCESASQRIPAEKAVIRRFPRQRIRIALQDFVADGGQSFAEHLADVGMPPGPPDDRFHAVFVDVADGQ